MIKIRAAVATDVPLILEFIHELAVYEREPNAVVATEADLLRDGFPANGQAKFHVLLADWNGEAAGFAFYFFIYSTWLGRPGLYLEDLIVRPALRGKGIGKALLGELARVALRENCYGMRWQVLDWNQPAIDFYESLGAKLLREWLTVRITGEPLERLAGRGIAD